MLKNLKKLREENNLSQTELARKLHVSQQVIAKYETSDTLPSSNMMIRIADFFNVSIDYLVDRTEIETRIDVIQESSLSRCEDYILREFRKYDDKQKHAIMHVMETFKPD